MGKKESSTGVNFTMEDGKLVWSGVGDSGGLIRVVYNPETAPPELRMKAMLNGFRVAGDRMTAISRDENSGKSATPAEKLARVQRRVDAWERGQWEIERSWAATKGPDAGLVIMAMIRALAGVPTVEAAEALFAKQVALKKFATRDEAIAAWAKSTQVAAAIKLIEAERIQAAARIDAEAMLADLMGDGSDDSDGSEDDDSDDEAPM